MFFLIWVNWPLKKGSNGWISTTAEPHNLTQWTPLLPAYARTTRRSQLRGPAWGGMVTGHIIPGRWQGGKEVSRAVRAEREQRRWREREEVEWGGMELLSSGPFLSDRRHSCDTDGAYQHTWAWVPHGWGMGGVPRNVMEGTPSTHNSVHRRFWLQNQFYNLVKLPKILKTENYRCQDSSGFS